MTAHRYRKKPVEIEAMQFKGGPAAATPIIDWMLANDCAATWSEAHEGGHVEGWDPYPAQPEGITIQTLEGNMLACVGDWVIRGIKGEFYPCKPDIFEATYESSRLVDDRPDYPRWAGSEPQEGPDPELDDLTRAQLAELAGPAATVAGVLDAWLHRLHGVVSSAHGAGLFLDLLAAEGWRVEPIQAPALEDLLPAPKE